ncbi:MAG: hypothetical protein D6743_06060 [Calditrichaeota bacterium]|nr:MAG: hypothetical protein D6743_06060 [Calditrichota bacterium]
MVDFLFRKTVFPVLLETDTCLQGAKNQEQLDRIIRTREFKNKRFYHVIDSTGEGWMFSAEYEVISPLSTKKQRFKKSIIEFYNSFFAEEDEERRFVGRSLSSKKLSTLVAEIAQHSQKHLPA